MKKLLSGGQALLTLLVCLFLIVPVVMSVMTGFMQNAFRGISGGFTLHWLTDVWSMYSGTFWLTLKIALACLICNLILGIPAAWGLLKLPRRQQAVIEECLLLPVAIPGLATALGMLLLYGRFHDFRGSWLFILSGHVLFTLPFMVRPVLAVMKSSGISVMEEAASSLGAGSLYRLFTVVIPNCWSGIIAGAFMVITLSIGEFNITWMLHTPLTKTLPVGLADSYASMRLETGSSYTTLFLIMIMPLLTAMYALPRLQKRLCRDDK
ncbi:ABC transporter permease [Tatumella citrea]|uniref:ABC transporter permease n=1 Tax=Tatumella citrea TaxID=53336 RepID=A0A1Y0LMZ9_TATCI|nr:ABC transporter permease subunit [Tatumella citrea]ARU95345.1 ABC transporter permease [Tatumella citrea]ARU99386.1 ABC transporter permease [Tatumella citrea]